MLPKAVEHIPRESAPFAPPPAPVAKETHRVQTPKDNVRSAPSVEPAPTQQRNEKPVVAPQSNIGELNLKDFMPVKPYVQMYFSLIRMSFDLMWMIVRFIHNRVH